MKINLMIAGVLILIFSQSALPETIKVGLEPFPPLVIDKDTGYTIDLLRAVEAVSDLKFDIMMMTYIRAKVQLKKSDADIIAHTPYKVETEDFYEYAQELDWYLEAPTDLYAMDKDKFNDIRNLVIGIPRGNESFLSNLTGIPVENFYMGKLENLLMMLKLGRIDAFWFGRASAMTTLKKLKIGNVHYMKFPKKQIFVGIALRKDRKGNRLKEKMESLIQKIDQKRIFKDYFIYLNMPDNGIFKLDK